MHVSDHLSFWMVVNDGMCDVMRCLDVICVGPICLVLIPYNDTKMKN